MASIRIEGVTTDEFRARLRKRLDNVVKGTAAAVTRVLRKQIDEAFKSQSDPETGSPWLPLKRERRGDYAGEPILDASGKGKRSIHVHTEIGETSFSVTVTSLEYMAIHNFGASVLHPGSNKRQFLFEPGAWSPRHPIGRWVTYTQPHLIPIPQRRWVAFTPDIKDAMREIVRENS